MPFMHFNLDLSRYVTAHVFESLDMYLNFKLTHQKLVYLAVGSKFEHNFFFILAKCL